MAHADFCGIFFTVNQTQLSLQLLTHYQLLAFR